MAIVEMNGTQHLRVDELDKLVQLYMEQMSNRPGAGASTTGVTIRGDVLMYLFQVRGVLDVLGDLVQLGMTATQNKWGEELVTALMKLPNVRKIASAVDAGPGRRAGPRLFDFDAVRELEPTLDVSTKEQDDHTEPDQPWVAHQSYTTDDGTTGVRRVAYGRTEDEARHRGAFNAVTRPAPIDIPLWAQLGQDHPRSM
jgi:hypothetical protein